MTPWDILRRLYDSEISAGMQTDWDGGITVWIGPPGSEHRRTFDRDEFDDVATWLDDEARRLFPDSDYARL